jgi:DEAD/DEAH box helicase domain-containing protein
MPTISHPGESHPAAPHPGGERRARSALGVHAIVERLRSDPELGPRFTHWRTEPRREARWQPLPAALDPRLSELLQKRGTDALYEHQARAIAAALAGRDVLVATPTASGKTLCYTLPVLQRLLATEGRARALFLFPTKALSQDQSAGLNALIEGLGAPWHSFTYDGDTPPSVRRTLRERGHVLLTNPWMLHAGILPNHPKWAELFRDLETIVIDEVHTLSGVFGSSVANVLRRLVRIAAHYGSEPRFVLSSATLREPALHARRLLGRDVEVVGEDASPAGERHFALYNPAMLNPVAGLRASALEEARRLAYALVGPTHQTIFFCNRRVAVDVLTRYLKEAAHDLGLDPDEVRGYRGGYLPLLRREIEEGLRSGAVKVVVSTNALELGIDIGRLDVACLVGYPGSQASFWQRAGRVGRRGAPSLVVQIARSDPIDQFLAQHPEHLFGAPRERLGLDPDNLVILSEQVKCAAFELPFRVAELEAGTGGGFAGSPHTAGVLDFLAEESRLLLKRGGTWHWMADAYPAQDVTLKGGGPDNVLILDLDTKKAIGEIDREAALTTVHEGAIYQVEGEAWKVERFDYENRRAYVRAVETDYFTEAETDTEVAVLRLERRRIRERAPDAGGGEDFSVYAGEVHVTTLATLYKKVRFYTRESVGAEDIHLPPEELDTQAFCLVLSEESAAELGLTEGDRGAAWAGLGRLVLRVAPLFLRCQPQDLGLSAQVKSKHFLRPALYLYDRVQGGVGLSEILFEEHREVLRAALDVVTRCECAQGCPACVQPPEASGVLAKGTALRVLEHLCAGLEARECEPDLVVTQGEPA